MKKKENLTPLPPSLKGRGNKKVLPPLLSPHRGEKGTGDKRGPLRLFLPPFLAALGLSLLLVGLRFSSMNYASAYAVYPLKRLIYWPPAALVLFAACALAMGPVSRLWQRQSAGMRRTLVLASLALLPLAAWLLPFPLPALSAPHRLVIAASAPANAAASAAASAAPKADQTLVEIRRLAYLSGGPVDPALLTRTPDWQAEGGVLYSHGAPGSRLELAGNLPGGVVVDLRYSPEGGPVTIEWDGAAQTFNLFARESTVVPYAFSGLSLFRHGERQSRLPLVQALLLAALSLVQLVGLYAVIWFGLLLVAAPAGGWAKTRAVSSQSEERAVSLQSGERAVSSQSSERAASLALCAVIMAGLFLGFLYLKVSAFRADTPRIFRDTEAYVQAADLPITSREFWAGTRAFSLPLFLKLLGTNSANFAEGAQMQRVAYAQLALSILSWSVLALVAAWCAKGRRSRVLVFAIVLFFSLSLEIGIWDALLLSESLTFSLLALLLAGWLAVVRGYAALPPPLRAGLLALNTLVMLLYAFTRDSNIYFILGGLVLLLAGWLLQARGTAEFRPARQAALALGAAALLLLVGQNLSLSAGNRWQIFMYDHLAARFLGDPTARDYFASQGLPLSDALLATTSMPGYEYQPLYYHDPAFQGVRDWVNTRSKAAYIQYLLTHPGETLLQPITNAPKLIWGSNLEYRSPLGGVQPAPARLAQLTAFFYNRQPWFVALLALAALAGPWLYRRRPSPLWFLIALLLITLYPLMFLVWHAEPLEIERHAAQLGIQFYLAGWLAVAEAISGQLSAVSGRRL